MASGVPHTEHRESETKQNCRIYSIEDRKALLSAICTASVQHLICQSEMEDREELNSARATGELISTLQRETLFLSTQNSHYGAWRRKKKEHKCIYAFTQTLFIKCCHNFRNYFAILHQFSLRWKSERGKLHFPALFACFTRKTTSKVFFSSSSSFLMIFFSTQF